PAKPPASSHTAMASSSVPAMMTSRNKPMPCPRGFPGPSAYRSNSGDAYASRIGGRIAVTSSRAAQRIEFGDDANGRNTGGYGFCNGFGTTPTEVSMPFSTPLPYFNVVSRSQGVAPAGTFQYLPLNVSISS